MGLESLAVVTPFLHIGLALAFLVFTFSHLKLLFVTAPLEGKTYCTSVEGTDTAVMVDSIEAVEAAVETTSEAVTVLTFETPPTTSTQTTTITAATVPVNTLPITTSGEVSTSKISKKKKFKKKSAQAPTKVDSPAAVATPTPPPALSPSAADNGSSSEGSEDESIGPNLHSPPASPAKSLSTGKGQPLPPPGTPSPPFDSLSVTPPSCAAPAATSEEEEEVQKSKSEAEKSKAKLNQKTALLKRIASHLCLRQKNKAKGVQLDFSSFLVFPATKNIPYGCVVDEPPESDSDCHHSAPVSPELPAARILSPVKQLQPPHFQQMAQMHRLMPHQMCQPSFQPTPDINSFYSNSMQLPPMQVSPIVPRFANHNFPNSPPAHGTSMLAATAREFVPKVLKTPQQHSNVLIKKVPAKPQRTYQLLPPRKKPSAVAAQAKSATTTPQPSASSAQSPLLSTPSERKPEKQEKQEKPVASAEQSKKCEDGEIGECIPVLCKYGNSCSRPGCHFMHSMRPAIVRRCKYDNLCIRNDCHFSHPNGRPLLTANKARAVRVPRLGSKDNDKNNSLGLPASDLAARMMSLAAMGITPTHQTGVAIKAQ
eukprot:CAMPEP_0175139252 /NCGR_PEP_ID=MMETSP0087-20121206/10797_1 /TAXON_ID=136419 /ORGANISM="Unknown Unknown, Strain D1" /LENGTH=595 /DNA_ID=CAMNT_0016422237 /DNA_START=111 /DNA_END=1898 /DNA_ORIENTATION=-